MTNNSESTIDDRVNELAVFYNQCRARRRRVLRAMRRNQGKAFPSRKPEYPTENQRWAQIYDLRLMEVDGEIHKIQSDPLFYKVAPRAWGWRAAPWATLAFTIGMVATIVAVVLFR